MKLPLHNTQDLSERLDLHLYMRSLSREDKGFRKAPTSRKNRAFHRNTPTTRVEALSKEVYGK